MGLRIADCGLRNVLAVLACLALLACGRHPAPERIDATNWEIPVVAEKLPPEAPAVEAMHAEEPVEMVITVPASSTPTRIQVRKAKRSVVQKALSNAPVHKVESSNPGVTAEQPKRSLWWRWLLVLLLALALVEAVLRRLSRLSPVGLLLGLLKGNRK